MAGHRVVLAIDFDSVCLRYHKINHPGAKHVRINLGPDSEERVLSLIRECVPSDKTWHLHGSPPCQLFSPMRHVTKGKNANKGMMHVEWYIDFALRSGANTWLLSRSGLQRSRTTLKEWALAMGISTTPSTVSLRHESGV